MSEKRKDHRGRVLKKGESQRTDRTYQYRYSDPFGKRRYVYADTLQELREKEAEIQRDLADGIRTVDGKMTVLELMDRYLSLQHGIRPNTVSNHNYVRKIVAKEVFGQRPIRDVGTSDVKLWFIKLNQEGKRYSTLQSLRGVLKPAFDMAVEEDILRKNPFAFPLSRVVANDTESREPLTDEQVDDFFAFVQNGKSSCKYYDQLVILLGTGLRVSELFGLTLADVDFKRRRIRVDRQLQYDRNGKLYVQKPKTASGERYIPLLDDAVLEAFRRVVQNRGRPKVETVVDGVSGFLFIDKNGKPKTNYSLQHGLKRIVEHYNETHEPITLTPHVLRHTFCTRMAQAGMPVKELQYLMGHADVGTTLNIYTHLSYDAAEKSMQKILLSG